MSDIDDLLKKVELLGKSFDTLISAGNKIDSWKRPFGENSEAIQNLQNVLASSAGTVETFGKTFGNVAANFGSAGALVQGFVNTLGGMTGVFANIANSSLQAGKVLLDTLDAPSASIRAMERSLFDLDKGFGKVSERSAEFERAFEIETTSRFNESLLMTSADLAAVIEISKRTSLTLDQLNTNVMVGTESIKLYSAAAAYAASTGTDVGTSVQLLNTLMNQQGMSAQSAVNTMGTYISVSKNTGIAIEDVASSLNRSVDGFAKLGMTAEFGRPALEGFARVVKDMGLGIEQASGLADGLTRALGSLATNYTNAYLIFQRGGLDLSSMSAGGGVLGASIGMQAAMLRSEREGPGAQADISRQLIGGLRDTLASFTGGQIVTVEQAAESPGLQTQFYTQQQLLKNQFGIGDEASANRVLDLLSRLDQATNAGNDGDMDALTKQIQEEMKNRDATMDASQKLERKMDMQIAVTKLGYRDQLLQGHVMSQYLAAMAEDKVLNKISGGTIQERRDIELMRQASVEVGRDLSEVFSGDESRRMLDELIANSTSPDRGGAETRGGRPTPTGSRSDTDLKDVRIVIDFSEDAKSMLKLVKMLDTRAGASESGVIK